MELTKNRLWESLIKKRCLTHSKLLRAGMAEWLGSRTTDQGVWGSLKPFPMRIVQRKEGPGHCLIRIAPQCL